MSKLVENLKAARASGVPLLAIVSQDQPATVDVIDKGVNACPKIAWDLINGLQPLNDEGKTVLVNLGDAVRDSNRPVHALKAIAGVTPKTMIFFYNAHAIIGEPPVVQAIQNLRESFKENKRTAVFLGPGFSEMRPELQADIVTLEEELPTEEQLVDVVTDLHGGWTAGKKGRPALDEKRLPGIVSAVRGLPALFTVEQVVAMSFRQEVGIDNDALWERKESAINANKGLEIERSKVTFADLAGMDIVMEFLRQYQRGPKPFRLILFWDEIEKMMAGAGGESQDSSGVSSDFLQVCLKKMEGLQWAGIVLLGIPGSGKTALCDATSGEFDVAKLTMDFGAMKGRYVGDSEGAVRQGFSVAESLGGEDVLVMATCNRMKSLPPEFRRRFWLGNWYFDLPSVAEQEPIKRIYEAKYGIENAEWPDTTDWTGAEIRNAARFTHRLGCSLKEAAKYIVPIARADKESVDDLRSLADGRFLDVSRDGTWERNKMTVSKKRSRALN